MDVKRVDNRTHFNGYVGKSVYEFVRAAVKNDCQDIINTANLSNKVVDVEALKNVKQRSAKVISQLEEYMKKLHKNTVLHIGSFTDFKETQYQFYLKNPVTSKTYLRENPNNMPLGAYRFECLYTLETLTSNLLLGAKPEYIDKRFLEFAAGKISKWAKGNIISQWIAKYLGKKADKYAIEIGEEPIYTASAISKIADNKTQKKESVRIAKLNKNLLHQTLAGE